MPEQTICDCGYTTTWETPGEPPRFCPECGRVFGATPVATMIPDNCFETPASDVTAVSTAPLWLRLLLDPQTIQRLLFGGGGLAVLGLIAWLISLGVFDDPRIVAIAMGIGTGGLLVSGWGLTLRTQHRLAGRALTFLACVLAPLNLWFYDAQGLVTLDGQLWVGSLVCCLMYLVTMYVLKDPLYLYAIEAGVTLTVLLCLGTFERHTDSVWICVALTSLAAASIHAERAFTADHPLYNRRKFGLPLFFSGQAQLAAGMLGLLGMQLLNWLQVPVSLLPWAGSHVATLPLVAGSLWLAAAYLWLYSDFVVRRLGIYSELAVVAVVMAEITFLQERLSTNSVMVTISVTALVVRWLMQRLEQPVQLWRVVSTVAGCVFALIPVVLAAHRHLVWSTWNVEGSHAVLYLLSCFVVALATLGSAGLMTGAGRHVLICAASLVGWIVGLHACDLAGLQGLVNQAPVLLSVPLILAVLSQRVLPEKLRDHCLNFAQAWVVSGVLLSLAPRDPHAHALSLCLTAPRTWQTLLAAVAFGELSLFSWLCARQQKTVSTLCYALSGIWGLLTLWKMVTLIDLDNVWYAPLLAAMGVMLSACGRWFTTPSNSRDEATVSEWSRAGDLILVIAELSAFLRGTFRLAGALALSSHGPLIAVVLTTLLAGVGCLLAATSAARRWHFVATLLLGLLSIATAVRFLSLLDYQKMELGAALLGCWMIVLGYVGRLKETTRERDAGVSVALWLGSLTATLPLLWYTLGGHWFSAQTVLFDELLLVTVTLLMLSTGCIFQVRSTTAFGCVILGLYLATLFAHLAYRPQVAVGVYLAVGGGVIFLLGLMLSIYRDRLLALPSRIAQREGVFQIIDWR